MKIQEAKPRMPDELRIVRRHETAPPRDRGFFKLRPGLCKFPMNSPPKGEPYIFCLEPAEASRPYCKEHDGRCYLKQTGRMVRR